MAEGNIESIWSQVGECHEGDACIDFDGPNDFAHHSIERLMGGGGLPVRRV